MIALLNVDPDVGMFTGDVLSYDDEDSDLMLAPEWFLDQIGPAIRFQSMRGRGQFVLSLPGV